MVFTSDSLLKDVSNWASACAFAPNPIKLLKRPLIPIDASAPTLVSPLSVSPLRSSVVFIKLPPSII